MKQDWPPHITVATVVRNADRYLLVEERDKQSGALVFNQPAGHLDPDESLFEAALRETREETGWAVELRGLLGVALYKAPGNGVTYLRNTFVAAPLHAIPGAVIDPDIHRVCWLDYDEIKANSARMRSPLVIAAIELERGGRVYPLDLIHHL